MKIKRPKENTSDIEVVSKHTVAEDDITGELEITEFEIKFKGDLSEWLEEYLNSPLNSRLHKNLNRIFRSWFE